jgi:predicted lipoprotein with Yx(FWY)xxD motif/nucleotide-binding universal stress UspA family protein
VNRGQLRVYLGYAPGAGTTCALLDEGHRRAQDGADVVVACAQTHGRAGPSALMAGLEIVSPAGAPYPGTVAGQMDLAAVLARRPEVALVDDLAHDSGPGSGHRARWQDVEDLLNAGIDVISAVRVSQLDSLADAVQKITGVPQRETVPDPFVRAADEVQLVDIAPESLQDRMARGHIYPPRQAQAALAGWFRIGNLSALRELALLWLAAKLASDPQRYRPGGRVLGSGGARERVLVALGGGPETQTLIRRAARIAARSQADLLAVHIARPGRGAAAGRATPAAQRQLVQSAGGSYHQVTGDDIPAALLAFAHAANATQLVLGATRPTRLAALRPAPSISSRMIRRGAGIDVHMITCTRTANGVPPEAREFNQKRRTVMTEQNTPRPVRAGLAPGAGLQQAAPGEGRHPRWIGWLAAAAVVVAALVVAACGSSSSGSGSAAGAPPSAGSGAAASSGSTLKTTTIGGATVLTNAKGFTLYSFAPDTRTASKCNGSCAQLWPPVKGPAAAAHGVTGKLSTITRTGGATQATYNGHPLYTYVADTAPGQAKGNGVNASGGVWHEVTVSGAAVSSSGGGGGSGY